MFLVGRYQKECAMRKTRMTLWTLLALLVAMGSARAQGSTKGTVSFTRDVAPILQEKCQSCHRSGSMAPMSLVTYEEVRPWARAVKQRVIAREMPPWHIDRTVGIQQFKNDISLSEAEIDTIARWVDDGAPRGDSRDLRVKQWPNEELWRLAETEGRVPDLIVKSTPWTQAAQGQDQWWQPSVDTGLTEDRWVKAVEVRPSMKGRRIVHHAIGLVEYAPGKPGEIYPDNTGRLLKAGGQINFDIHYHSVGEAITDQVEVGLWLYPRGYVPKYQVKTQALGSQEARKVLDIPPNTVTTHDSYIPLTEPTLLLSFQPHMHTRGKAMSMEAIYPDGHREMLSYVSHFSFNWHVNYVYEDSVAPILPKGTVIHITAWHDNTAGNRANPDPNQWVGWGQRSYDEMFHCNVTYINLSQEEYERRVQQRNGAKQLPISTAQLRTE
jgi:hypothetical protein